MKFTQPIHLPDPASKQPIPFAKGDNVPSWAVKDPETMRAIASITTKSKTKKSKKSSD